MQRASAFDCSLRILTLRDHAEAELRRKLERRGYQEEEVEASIVRLKELGYLDDLRFARSYAASLLRNGKGYGVRLRMELSRRGVAAAIADEVLGELTLEYGEAELLAQVMERRYGNFDPKSATDKEKRKVIGYLQRKGFSLGAIFRQLNAQGCCDD